MQLKEITRLTLGAGAVLVLVVAGCGGDGKDEPVAPSQSSGRQSSGSQSKSSKPTSEKVHAAGIPDSHGDQEAYFRRVYCVGDSQAQCKCKLEVMGIKDESTFGTVLYKLKRSDPATVLRFGRASTGCA